ncbi:MAG: tRNA (adenine(22)-N(1))-methyltransferase [Bacillota bacterium]
MELKGRLKLIADMTPKCDIVCDIGTDHAYIPIYLVKNGKCKKAVAADVKSGPLKAAQKNIDSFGLRDYIIAKIGDGLSPIEEDEADVIVIAGMGGMLIREILESNYSKAVKANALILQPMNAIELVREWLYEHGFEVYSERLVSEGHKIYNAIAAKWTGVIQKKDEVFYYIGQKLIENRDPLLKKYIEKKISQLDKIIYEMESMKNKDIELRTNYIKIRNDLIGILKGDL